MNTSILLQWLAWSLSCFIIIIFIIVIVNVVVMIIIIIIIVVGPIIIIVIILIIIIIIIIVLLLILLLLLLTLLLLLLLSSLLLLLLLLLSLSLFGKWYSIPMQHNLCRSFHPWCPGVKNRCLLDYVLKWGSEKYPVNAFKRIFSDTWIMIKMSAINVSLFILSPLLIWFNFNPA